MKQINYLDFPREYLERKILYQEAFDRVMKSGVYILGSEVLTFEEELSGYLGVKYCVGVANGLEAIQISLMTLGVGVGDEVITTPLSAVATTLAILAVGATPVFVDIKENGQIDENSIEKAISKKTKAVLPVHLYGQPCRIDKIKEICLKFKLFLIEDACQAHGTTLGNKVVGTFGDISCYSFYPTKNLGAIGDGGAIATNNENINILARQIRDYGQETKYKHVLYGLNSRLDELQAALLKVKLKYLDIDNTKRRQVARNYIKLLENISKIEVIKPNVVEDSNFHLLVIRTQERNKLQNYLKENRIPSLIHYPITIPDQPMFNGKYKSLKIPVAREFVGNILSLPCHPFLKSNEIEYICNVIQKFFK